ncbi:MAG: HAD-IIIA family hydrolase [Acidobacteriota bacterium]|nr:HAD-IIIA family hydrolase [Acidobacteriota bacterium]
MSYPGCPDYTIVVPTVGRPSLVDLLESLGVGDGPAPREVVLVDDRRGPGAALPSAPSGLSTRVLVSGGRGPAAARNTGWRSARTEWVVFLDDDVVPGPSWRREVVADLAGRPWLVAGCQGRVTVPLPSGRRPTDWERNTAGLETARWATADMAYRREVLEEVGGFDERFRRAFREDADLGLRVTEAGYQIEQGCRWVRHPVRPAGAWVSVAVQAGNADDVLMRARHGTGWRSAAGAEPGRNGRHLMTTAAAVLGLGASIVGRRRLGRLAAATWAASTGAFAVGRVRPGPRSAAETAKMALTSVVIPPVAVGYTARGWAELPAHLADRRRSPLGRPVSPLVMHPPRVLATPSQRPRWRPADVGWKPAALLFDRDGTLIADLPGNTDPERVTLMPGARAAVRRARAEGLAVGVVSNQSAVGRGRVTAGQVAAINRRVDELIGPFDTWQVCFHAPDDGCRCRKPAPGLIEAASTALGVEASGCVVVGDIGSDVAAARAAGARAVLVPTRATLREEVAAAAVVAADLGRAVDLVLGGMC